MPVFYHYLFAFALLSRISDLLTTWLVTPTLKLEANPFVRKFRWPFGFLTLFIAFFAYGWPEACVAITTTSFLVAGSNATKIPFARSMGEDALYRLTIESAAKGSLWVGLLSRLAPVPFYVMLAGFIFFFFPTPDTWAFWIAFGVIGYSVALLVHYPRSYLRYRKLGRALIRGDTPHLDIPSSIP